VGRPGGASALPARTVSVGWTAAAQAPNLPVMLPVLPDNSSLCWLVRPASCTVFPSCPPAHCSEPCPPCRFVRYVPPTLFELRKSFVHVVPLGTMNFVSTLCAILEVRGCGWLRGCGGGFGCKK